ncbi:uncharacterized protein B0P05DRAFT_549638 [Gilbertella persicaria]|uniref:uncharacterized protein n=1 Tax=Gilbertella persicaria TaxID=101096 RepID=UPI0022202EED|nr:uncharacterized protein B0P05DRAFT_549638 [Gilbertella persicaria]KAI8071111.1 hypothetical protein B0P05DRAFT_549638 [Gilbertella persicaria]
MSMPSYNPNNNNNFFGHPYHPYSDNNKMFSFPPPPPLVVPPSFDRDISPPRKRTRTSPEQLAILEKSFSLNPSPNNRVREQLAHQLGMPERSIQIWFQNRRAKVKNQAKRSAQLQDSTLYMQQQYAASAAAAACQTAAFQQQQDSIDPNLYYYYYYYYFHQQQHQNVNAEDNKAVGDASQSLSMPPPPPPPPTSSSSSFSSSSPWSVENQTGCSMTPPIHTGMPDLTLSASTSSSSTTSDNYRHSSHVHRRNHYRSSSASLSSERIRAHSVGPYPYYRKPTPQERHSSLGPPSSISSYHSTSNIQPQQLLFSTEPRLYNSSTIIEEAYHLPTAHESVRYPQQTYNLSVQNLQIGSWKRVSDLHCHVDLSARTLIWSIGDDQQSFRIEINLNLVQFIRTHNLGSLYKLEFFLSSPSQVKFFMTVDGTWVQCHDFTQDKQASSENVHVLEGFSLLRDEFMDILMQAPDLQSLVIEEEKEEQPESHC